MQIKKSGFILSLENIAAIAVLLLVVGIGLWNFLDPIRSSKVSSARGECSSIAAAVSQYHYEIGEYPASLKELTKKKGNFGPWIATIPIHGEIVTKSYQRIIGLWCMLKAVAR